MSTQVDLIKKYGLKIRGHLGQHLLVDPNLQNKMVDLLDLEETDEVVEIGPGLGALTHILAKKAKKVLVIEKDSKFSEILNKEYSDLPENRFHVINRDVLDVEFEKEIKPLLTASKVKVISNLPYYVTAPILFKLLEWRQNIERCVVMMQKEVADRLVAMPGSKDYSRLTLAMRYSALVDRPFDISRHCFTPKPSVDSSAVTLKFEVTGEKFSDEDFLFHVIKICFSQRRKKLINLLCTDPQIGLSKEELKKILSQLGMDEKARGEELLLKDYLALAQALLRDVQSNSQ